MEILDKEGDLIAFFDEDEIPKKKKRRNSSLKENCSKELNGANQTSAKTQQSRHSANANPARH